MRKELYQNLIQTLEGEIQSYTELRDLFQEKKETLKQSKPDDLGILDNKIISCNNKIKNFNKSRQNIAMEIIGNENANMSDFIKKAKYEASEYVNILQDKKDVICELIKELDLLNQQNLELLKHGMTITNKMLESVIEVFSPKVSFYNGSGKTDVREVDMWTINKEV